MLEILEKAPQRIKINIVQEKFIKNDFILVQGEVNEYLYFIVCGKIEVSTMSKQGQKISITTFRKGESFGVLEIFNSEIHTQNVIVMDDCVIKKIHKNYVLDWMKQDFNFTLYVIKLLEECFYDTSVFARNVLSMTIKERVVVALYKHHNANNLYLLSKSDLLQETGTQKRSLNRIIEELTQMGIIKYESKRITITDIKLLTLKAKILL